MKLIIIFFLLSASGLYSQVYYVRTCSPGVKLLAKHKDDFTGETIWKSLSIKCIIQQNISSENAVKLPRNSDVRIGGENNLDVWFRSKDTVITVTYNDITETLKNATSAWYALDKVIVKVFSIKEERPEELSNRYLGIEVIIDDRGNDKIGGGIFPINNLALSKEFLHFTWANAGREQFTFEIFEDTLSADPIIRTKTPDTSYRLAALDLDILKAGKRYYWTVSKFGAYNKKALYPFRIIDNGGADKVKMNCEEFTAFLPIKGVDLAIANAGYFESLGYWELAADAYEKAIKEFPKDKSLVEMYQIFRLKSGQ
jgi:hypothetical protein